MAQKVTRTILGEEITVYWNYRVMARNEGEETNLYITEVYYNSDGSTIGWTEGKEVYGENIDELRQNLTWMLEALDKPVLDESALLSEAETARENGDEDIFPSERLSLKEVLDSLGLEREDVEDWENEDGT